MAELVLERLARQGHDLACRLKGVVETLRRDWQLYAMLAPLVLWFGLFLYRPIWGLQIAFKDYSLFLGIAGSPWVGLENFAALLDNEDFLRAFANTLVLAGLNLLFVFPVPVALALMFNEVRHARLRSAAQLVTWLPHFISAVIVAGLVIAMLAPSTGIVNVSRRGLGLDEIYFLTRPEWFRGIFIGSSIWKEAGFESIVYMAAITAIDPALYEAARVDGASRWQMLWRITLPSVMPTVVLMLIIRIGNIVEVGFEYILLLYQPSTLETADVVATFTYRTGLQHSQYAEGAAAGLFNSVVALILVAVANWFARRRGGTSLW